MHVDPLIPHENTVNTVIETSFIVRGNMFGQHSLKIGKKESNVVLHNSTTQLTPRPFIQQHTLSI